jgi:hypothetical protein
MLYHVSVRDAQPVSVKPSDVSRSSKPRGALICTQPSSFGSHVSQVASAATAVWYLRHRPFVGLYCPHVSQRRVELLPAV